MTSWLLLTDVERRRVSRVAVRLARANPLLVPAAVGVVVGVMWLAIKAGAGAAILAVFLPSGLSAVLAMILLGGVLVGLGLAAAAPRFEGLDPQIRTVPIAPLPAYLGTTALPLTIAWLIFAIPVFDFGTSLFRTIQVPAPDAWAGLLLLTQLIACVTGAAIMELLRARPSRRALLGAIPLLLALGLPALVAHLTSAPAWSWLAALLPHGLGKSSHAAVAAIVVPSIATSLLGVLAVGALAAGAWTATATLPGRAPAGSEHVRSRRIPRRLTLAMGSWLILTAARDSRVRVVFLLSLVSGAGMITATALLAGRSAAALAPLAAILLVQFAAGAPLALSSDLAQGRWLWRSIPPTGSRVGLSWWIVIGTITAAISLVVVAPVFAVMPLDAYPFVLGALVMAAPIPAAVGRLLPFRHDALARQLGLLALQLVFFLGALGIAELIAQRFALEAAPLVVLVGVLALTAAICTRAPWREA
jgi:hypothetical protein